MRRGRVPIQSHGGEKNVARLPRRDLRDRGTFERSKIQPAVSGRAHARIGFRHFQLYNTAQIIQVARFLTYFADDR